MPLCWAEHAAMVSLIAPFALGWIAGMALQLQQAQLWAAEVYWELGVAAVALGFARFLRLSAGPWLKAAAWFVLACTLAFSLAVARARHYLQTD